MPSALFSGCLHALALIYQSDFWSLPRAAKQVAKSLWAKGLASQC